MRTVNVSGYRRWKDIKPMLKKCRLFCNDSALFALTRDTKLNPMQTFLDFCPHQNSGSWEIVEEGTVYYDDIWMALLFMTCTPNQSMLSSKGIKVWYLSLKTPFYSPIILRHPCESISVYFSFFFS